MGPHPCWGEWVVVAMLCVEWRLRGRPGHRSSVFCSSAGHWTGGDKLPRVGFSVWSHTEHLAFPPRRSRHRARPLGSRRILELPAPQSRTLGP